MDFFRKYSIIIGILVGVALTYFTHPYWCPCHSAPSNVMPLPAQSHTDIVEGKQLDSADQNILQASRGNVLRITTVKPENTNSNVEPVPISIITTPCPDKSFKTDTSISWKVIDSSKKVIDSGSYHISFISDCLYSRTVDLFVESTPFHAPASAEKKNSPLSGSDITGFAAAYHLLKVSGFLEHDFARGGYTLGLRARITLGNIEIYGAASIGAENLPVGGEYVFWKP